MSSTLRLPYDVDLALNWLGDKLKESGCVISSLTIVDTHSEENLEYRIDIKRNKERCRYEVVRAVPVKTLQGHMRVSIEK